MTSGCQSERRCFRINMNSLIVFLLSDVGKRFDEFAFAAVDWVFLLEQSLELIVGLL